jgi:hypothetical protein
MFPENKRIKEVDCPVCYAAHDEEIHQATLRLRDWFHHEVTHRLEQEEYFEAALYGNLEPARVA